MKKLPKVIIITFIVLLVLLPVYRLSYGNWNPLKFPERIICYGRIYNSSHLPLKTFSKGERPKYAIYSFNIILGRRLFSMNQKQEYVPTVIYLYVGNDQYKSYALSGGP